MTRIHLHDIVLSRDPFHSSRDTLPVNAQLNAQVLDEDKLIVRSEPGLYSESDKSWTFRIRSEIPEGCSSFTIDLADSSPTQTPNYCFHPVSVEVERIVSNADDSRRYALTTQIATSIGCTFNLRASFEIHELLLFPLDHNTIGETLMGAVTEAKLISAYNMTVLYDSVQNLPHVNRNKSFFLVLMGIIYMKQYAQSHSVENLTKAVDVYSKALRDADHHDDRTPFYMVDYGSCLLDRYNRFGELSDINDSVTNIREAVRLAPERHWRKPAMLSDLGMSLLERFERLGELSDLNESVIKGGEAVQLAPHGDPFKPFYLNILGFSLLRRFQRLGELGDLNDSIIQFQEAVLLFPDGPTLGNLGFSLLVRFGRLRELKDLYESIIQLQNAVKVTPDDNPEKLDLLNNLGNSLLMRFERLEELGDLNDSVVKFQEAVGRTPDGHPKKPTRLTCLGVSLLKRFHRLNSAQDMADAASAFSCATRAEYGAPSIRLFAARRWAGCLRALRILNVPPASLLEPYRIAIPLLSEVAWLGSSLPDRHYQVMKYGTIVHEAAVIAFEAGDHALAVEWLEQGRCVIWSQLLHLRTPLDNLDIQEPVLSQRLRNNSLQLEDTASQRLSSATNDLGRPCTDYFKLSTQDLADCGHRLAMERKELLAEIRQRPCFERFLLPKRISQLTQAASDGPIVILTYSELESTCCAIIMLPNLPDDILPLKLESFPPSTAIRLYDLLKQLLRTHGRIVSPYDDNSDETARRAASVPDCLSAIDKSGRAEEDLRKFIIEHQNDGNKSNVDFDSQGLSGILAELWECVAKPILDILAITNPSPESNPRLWWCPTGVLSFLPLHAAGLYHTGAPHDSKLSDFVVSSYIPTLSSLTDLTTTSTPLATKPKLLAVARESDLPGALVEIEDVKEAVNGYFQPSLLHGSNATLEKVLSELKTANWVHFACHGVQNLAQPIESALLLAGTDRLTLAKLSSLRIARGDLAFLSACQTATGDEQLSDEAVHLSAGMLIAGYRGVIATMWSVDDRVAPKVARDVYEHLVSSGADPGQAARALHLAVQKLREDNWSDDDLSLMSWVPFIHIGK